MIWHENLHYKSRSTAEEDLALPLCWVVGRFHTLMQNFMCLHIIKHPNVNLTVQQTAVMQSNTNLQINNKPQSNWAGVLNRSYLWVSSLSCRMSRRKQIECDNPEGYRIMFWHPCFPSFWPPGGIRVNCKHLPHRATSALVWSCVSGRLTHINLTFPSLLALFWSPPTLEGNLGSFFVL